MLTNPFVCVTLNIAPNSLCTNVSRYIRQGNAAGGPKVFSNQMLKSVDVIINRDGGFNLSRSWKTTATQTQGKETATRYTTVIPPALVLIYLPPSTTCCAPTGPHPVTRFPLAPPPACQNSVRYKYTTHPIPCHTSSTCL